MKDHSCITCGKPCSNKQCDVCYRSNKCGLNKIYNERKRARERSLFNKLVKEG